MSRTYKVIVALVVIVVVAYAGWHFYEARKATKAGLLTENIVHNGNEWVADFTATIPAPEPAVYAAIRDIEKARSDQIRNVEVISQTANAKTVEMEMKGMGDQTVKAELAFEYDPANHRITYHTVDNPDVNLQGQYQFTDQGSSTLITYHQTSTLTQSMPVPDVVVKQIIRQVFIAQLDGLKRTLNIASAEEPDESSEEP